MKSILSLLFCVSMMLCFQAAGCAQANAPNGFDEPIRSEITEAGPQVSMSQSTTIQLRSDVYALPLYRDGQVYHPLWNAAGNTVDPATRNDPPRFPPGLTLLTAAPCDWVVDGSICACEPCAADIECGRPKQKCYATRFQLDLDPKNLTSESPPQPAPFAMACCRAAP